MTSRILTLTAGLLLALPALAGDSPFSVSAGILVNQGNTRDMTGKTTGGYTVEAGYQIAPADWGAKVQAYAGWNKFPAAAAGAGAPAYALDCLRLGVDLVYQPWDGLPLIVRGGPAAFKWHYDDQGAPLPGDKQDTQVKLGGRLGLGWDFGRGWSASVVYSFSEWRANPDLDYREGFNPSHPSFLTVMASYRF